MIINLPKQINTKQELMKLSFLRCFYGNKIRLAILSTIHPVCHMLPSNSYNLKYYSGYILYSYFILSYDLNLLIYFELTNCFIYYVIYYDLICFVTYDTT